MTTSSSHPASLRVLVAGGGPVGLVAANLLASYGIDVVLVERNASTSDDAKAISMDAESVRTLHMCGLGDRVNAVIAPGTGVRFYGRGNRRLFQARGSSPYVLGYAIKSQFSQPELERVLIECLAERDNVEIRMSTELLDVRQDENDVVVTVRGADGIEQKITVDYLVGCDGGRSTIRGLCNISMTGESFDDVWLVVDTIDDTHDDRCSMHFGDPERPHVIVPGGDGRCRYEFLLRTDEGAAGETPPFTLVQRLLAPYRSIAPEQIERSVNYRFHGLVADRWRDRRILLLGDAVHMMPPFAGQGLNSGVRDAANLAWKLSMLGQGRAGDKILETYEVERKPHAEAIVKASVRQGKVVMTTSRAVARMRDVAVRVLLAFPPTRRYLIHLNYLPRPHFRTGVVLVDKRSHPLVGMALDQPYVQFADSSQARLDTILGTGFTLLGVDAVGADWERVEAEFDYLNCANIDIVLGDRRPRSTGTRLAVGDADGELETLLSTTSGCFVLLRPDRYVAAVFPAEKASSVAAAIADILGIPGRTPATASDYVAV